MQHCTSEDRWTMLSTINIATLMTLTQNEANTVLDDDDDALVDYLLREGLVPMDVPVPRPSLPSILAYLYSEGYSYLNPSSASVAADVAPQSRSPHDNDSLGDYMLREGLVPVNVLVRRATLPRILAYLKDTSSHDPRVNGAAGGCCLPVVELECPETTTAGTEPPHSIVLTSSKTEGDNYLNPSSASVAADVTPQSRSPHDNDSLVDYMLSEGLVPVNVLVRRATLPRILAYLKDTSSHDPRVNGAAGLCCLPVVELECPETTTAGTEPPHSTVLTNSRTESQIRSIRPRSARGKEPLYSTVVSTDELATESISQLELQPTLCPGDSIDPIMISDDDDDDDDDCVPITPDNQGLADSSSHSPLSPRGFLQSSSQPSAQSADNFACTVDGFNSFSTGGDKQSVRTALMLEPISPASPLTLEPISPPAPLILEPISPASPFTLEPISSPESSPQSDEATSTTHHCEHNGCNRVFDDPFLFAAHVYRVHVLSAAGVQQSESQYLVQSSSQPSAQNVDNLSCTVDGSNSLPTGGEKHSVRTSLTLEPISLPGSFPQLDPARSKTHRCEHGGCDQAFDHPLLLAEHVYQVHVLSTPVVQQKKSPYLLQSSSQTSAPSIDNLACTVDGSNSFPEEHSERMPLIPGPILSASQTSSTGVTESRGNAIAAKKRRRKTHDCEYDGCRKTYARKDQLEAHVHRDHLLGPPQTNVTANDNFKSKVTGRRPTQHRNKSPRSRRRIILSKPSDAVAAGDSHRRYDTSPRHTSNAVLSASPTSTLHKKVRKRLPLIYECEYAGCGRTFCNKVRLVRHVQRNHISRSQPRSYAEICKFVESSSNYVDVAENSTCIIDDFSAIPASPNSALTNSDPFIGASLPLMPISSMPTAIDPYRRQYKCEYERCGKVYDKRHLLKVHVQRIHSMHLPSDGCASFAPVPLSARSTQAVDLDVDLGVDLSVPPLDTGLLVEDSQCGARPASDTSMSILLASSSSATAVESPGSLNALAKVRPATYHYCPHHGCSEVCINKFMLAAHIKRSHSQSGRTTQETQPYSNVLLAENVSEESAAADDMMRVSVSHTDHLISRNQSLLDVCHLAGSVGDLRSKLYADSSKNKWRGNAQTSRKQLAQYVPGPADLKRRRRRKFRCKDCDRVYRKKSALAMHARCHTDGRPYLCSEPGCNERFHRTDQRSRHEKAHSGERPHRCQLCGDGFKRSDHLVKHKMCVHRHT